ncbi:MAG: hypothetical protein PHF00_00635 [Elusimicrobia bacterium]|nr:hypothetical protein [Elusimicrobiota bacterium]
MRKRGWRHFCLVMKNQPGLLARLTWILTREAAGIEGMTIATFGDKASVQFLAPGGGLRRALRGKGFHAVESRVVEKRSCGRSLKLRRLVRILGERGLAPFSFCGMDGCGGRMIRAGRSEDPGSNQTS